MNFSDPYFKGQLEAGVLGLSTWCNIPVMKYDTFKYAIWLEEHCGGKTLYFWITERNWCLSMKNILAKLSMLLRIEPRLFQNALDILDKEKFKLINPSWYNLYKLRVVSISSVYYFGCWICSQYNWLLLNWNIS